MLYIFFVYVTWKYIHNLLFSLQSLIVQIMFIFKLCVHWKSQFWENGPYYLPRRKLTWDSISYSTLYKTQGIFKLVLGIGRDTHINYWKSQFWENGPYYLPRRKLTWDSISYSTLYKIQGIFKLVLGIGRDTNINY